MISVLKRVASQGLATEDGQDMVEYALLLGMISITALALIILVGPAIKSEFQFIVNGLSSA